MRLVSIFYLGIPILATLGSILSQPLSPRSSVSLSLSPGSTVLNAGQRVAFTPSVGGTSDPSVTWSLSPQLGTLANGDYQAPAIIANRESVTIKATSVADSSKTASSTVLLQPVVVTVTPDSELVAAGKSVSFTTSVSGTGDARVAWSINPAIGTLRNGVYTAPDVIGSLQTVTLTAASMADATKKATATITLTPYVNRQNLTPHFGNDGSQLTSYVPGKSMFVRSVFFSLVSNLAQYSDAFRAAQVNTLESSFYVPPNNGGNNYTSSAKWESDFRGYLAPSVEAAVHDGFNIILTGDAIARGSDAVYDSVSGPSTAWTTDPITYAFTWAKNLGKVIGVEMVDEISSQFAVPFPQGRLGQPGGPQQISCVDDLCTVAWPSQPVVQNGAEMFLISGATSNANLNRTVHSLYHQNSGFVLSSNPDQDGFKFSATGVGTQTFTAATDPDLTLQMFAAVPEGPDGADYIHNDAISQIMSYVNAVPGRPAVTWPAAAAAPPANFGAWMAPGASDYNDLYFTFLVNSNPTSYTLGDGLLAFNTAWNAKYPFAQRDKPTLMLVSSAGVNYNIVGTSIPIASFDGNTLTLSQPHGITSANVGLTRLSVSGNTDSSLNGDYYVYNVVNSHAVQVYPGNPTGPTVSTGVRVTFSDGQVLNLTGGYAGTLSPTGIQFDGTSYCVNQDNFGQVATVSSSTYTPYGGKWYILPAQFDNLIDGGTCTWHIGVRPLVAGQSGTGGAASVIADNYYHAGVSKVTAPGVTPDLVAANIMYAAEMGAAGVRVYAFGGDVDRNQGIDACFTGCGVQDNANPFYNGSDAQARWQGMSNAFNLIHEIEPYLLQPKLDAPNYGPTMITSARTSNYGTLLMLTEFADSPQVVNVDLSPYNPSGGAGTMYIMTGEQLDHQSVSGTSKQITFSPGETVAFTFPAANQIAPARHRHQP